MRIILLNKAIERVRHVGLWMAVDSDWLGPASFIDVGSIVGGKDEDDDDRKGTIQR